MTPPARALVVGALVAIKWLVEGEDSEAALALQGTNLAAPALFRIEAANVLRSLIARQQVARAEARDLLALLQTAPVTIVEQDDTLERRALDVALALGYPLHDCLYLALAERIGRRLVTVDGRFLRALAGTKHEERALHLSVFAGPGGVRRQGPCPFTGKAHSISPRSRAIALSKLRRRRR